MILINAFAALTGVTLLWAGATGRLNYIVIHEGEEVGSNVGNALAIGGGICVVVSAVVG
jgi:hypothetical protein